MDLKWVGSNPTPIAKMRRIEPVHQPPRREQSYLVDDKGGNVRVAVDEPAGNEHHKYAARRPSRG